MQLELFFKGGSLNLYLTTTGSWI